MPLFMIDAVLAVRGRAHQKMGLSRLLCHARRVSSISINIIVCRHISGIVFLFFFKYYLHEMINLDNRLL